MFAIERQSKIKEKLFREKRIDVLDLSQLFSVTEVTIRRDLDKLEQEGFLIKTYGGAVLNKEYLIDSKNSELEDNSYQEKKMIGKIAAQMVENGEAIFLAPGSTSLEIAKNLKDKKITVVTNDLMIGFELRDTSGVKVIVTGGDLKQSSSILVGGFALQALSGIYITKAFIEVKGVNFDSCYTLDSNDEVLIINEVLKITNEAIIVADYTKFNKTAFARLGDFKIAKKIISNKQIPVEYKSYYFENSIKLYTTFEFE